MRVAALLLVGSLLAAGCGERGSIASYDIGGGMPTRCVEGDGCAWAWWNATVSARGNFGAGLRWPTPEAPELDALLGGPPGQPIEYPWWWGWVTNASATGGGLQFGPSPDSGYAYLNGVDAARGGSFFFAHDGEALFRSRWNWSAEQDDTVAQPGKIWGDFRNVTMSFEARWGECERRAAYWFAEPRAVDGTYMLVGSDVVRCG